MAGKTNMQKLAKSKRPLDFVKAATSIDPNLEVVEHRHTITLQNNKGSIRLTNNRKDMTKPDRMKTIKLLRQMLPYMIVALGIFLLT